MGQKWDIEKVKAFVDENSNSILLSKNYKNQKRKIRIYL